jgi:transposase
VLQNAELENNKPSFKGAWRQSFSLEEYLMSLHPQPISPIPEEPFLVAHAAFANGNLCLTLRDTFGTLYKDEDFGEFYSKRGQPAQSPWRLAL